MSRLPRLVLEPIVRTALAEDLGLAGDVTASLLPASARLSARFVARKGGVVAGLDCAALACALVDPELSFTARVEDGAALAPGEALATVTGPARAVLTAERTALNFLTHLSGVATLTRAFVDAVAGTGARIAATRKTLPGLRAVQKAAVVAGGGWPHRYALADAVLVKDNHIAAAGGVGAALAHARAVAGHMAVVEVEVDTLAQLDEALAHGPDVVLLDNFSLADLATAVARAKGRAVLEASGGVSLASVRAIAETGVDVISVGALTHSAPALDIGLDAM
ncbi:MAG: carboxylating nicotinate-nucleotide diphosphorylase [Alphaproteobacteria bacterium]|nr:carboxylating nicotinate-nucleotide diphosphorylase [Alphaproteobacteria bacterium]